MLNCTSPCIHPLSQLHEILFIVAARFISAIPIGQSLNLLCPNFIALIDFQYS